MDDCGNTPLHLAAANGHAAATKMLLKCGSNKIAKNKVGYTPYQVAKLHNQHHVVRLLPSRGEQKMFKLKFATALMAQGVHRPF